MSENDVDDGETPAVGIDHPTVVPANYTPDNVNGNAIIHFSDDASRAFRDLVKATLDQSRFIDTRWSDGDLLLTEV